MLKSTSYQTRCLANSKAALPATQPTKGREIACNCSLLRLLLICSTAVGLIRQHCSHGHLQTRATPERAEQCLASKLCTLVTSLTAGLCCRQDCTWLTCINPALRLYQRQPAKELHKTQAAAAVKHSVAANVRAGALDSPGDDPYVLLQAAESAWLWQ